MPKKDKMKKRFCIAVILAAISCGGCGSKGRVPVSAARTSAASMTVIASASSETCDGVTYLLPPARPGQPEYPREIVTGNYRRLDNTTGVLENHEGRLSLEGVRYGRVKKGDQVRITLDRRIFVNGTERIPK